jgi:cytochrome c553
MSMKVILIGVGCAAALLAAPAGAQDTNAARNLASTCFTCHGNDGRSVGGVPPSLAGRSKAELLQALKDFKDGKRPATIMHQHAKGYTDQQLDAIAGYFAGVKAGPAEPAPAARARF